MTNLITNHELQKAVSFAVSKKCAARINEYWRAHGVDARAEVGPGGEISSKLNVTKHIPRSGQGPAVGLVPYREQRP